MWRLVEAIKSLVVTKPSQVYIIPELKVPFVGVPEIDDEHSEIIRMITDTGTKCNNVEFLNFSLKCLDYIYNHFRSEEQYMASIDYPGLRIHRLAHKSLYAMMRVYLCPKEIQCFTHAEIMDECKKALIMHIKNHDMHLSHFVNSGKFQTVA